MTFGPQEWYLDITGIQMTYMNKTLGSVVEFVDVGRNTIFPLTYQILTEQPNVVFAALTIPISNR